MKYKVYAGYYEIYVTESELDKPYMFQFETDDEKEIFDYLDDVDDTILVEDLLGWEDYGYQQVTVNNGKPDLIDDTDKRLCERWGN